MKGLVLKFYPRSWIFLAFIFRKFSLLVLWGKTPIFCELALGVKCWLSGAVGGGGRGWSGHKRASCLVQSFLVKHQITQVTQPPCSPDLVPCDFWLFPKLKSTFEREEISDHWWDSGNTTGHLMAIGRTVWGPKCLLRMGLRHHCPVHSVSCILYKDTFNKCL